MKTKDYTLKTGKLKTFHAEQEDLEMMLKTSKNKPSSRMIRTKKGKKALAALIELETSHNHSWYTELKSRSNANPTATALFYRGTKITFSEMFEHADEVAKSLAKCGIKKGDEIPCCLANTPELVYIMLAANKIGAKLNLFGSHLPSEYLNEILDSCTDKLFIATDDFYGDIRKTISARTFANKVIISLADSLPKNPELTAEYEPSLKDYYHYENKAQDYIKSDTSLKSFKDFIQFGSDYDQEIIDSNNLDTEFLVTYTSGSTKVGYPKQIIHSNRSLITSGRFHDSELSGNPKLEGLRGLAHIHSESNTDLITCISDNLMQLWSVGLEPEYDKKKALDYVILNKPNYLNAPTSFFIEMAKEYLIERRYHEDGVGIKLPFLLASFAVGEGCSKGEEKLINTFLRKSRAGSGVKIAGLSMPYTTLSVGGGDCEHGGIYYTLWRTMFEKMNYLRLKKREYGLMPESYAQVSAFHKLPDGTYKECDFNEYGLIAANSATTMVGYKNNPEKTRELIITDNLGRDWISSNVYGYIDELGTVHVKGRVGNTIVFQNGYEIPAFIVEDAVCQDTKNILSCTVTKHSEGQSSIPIINLEFQPNKKNSDEKVIESLLERCNKAISPLDPTIDSAKEFGIRIFDHDKSFPLTISGKRSTKAIEDMGLSDVKFISVEKPKSKIRKKN
jgi:acyl-coenzyme A synthetase/AMP-(fatty) acid ligase